MGAACCDAARARRGGGAAEGAFVDSGRAQGLQRGVKRKSTPQIDLLREISGGEIEMDTFPSPLTRRNRPSIEEKGREGEREEKKKGGREKS